MKKFALLTFLILGAISYSALNSPPLLAKVAEFSWGNQTKLFTFCLDRIYSNIECNEKKYLSKITDPNGYFFQDQWIRILAVSGNVYAAEFIQKELENAVLHNQKTHYFLDYIKAAGVLGLTSAEEVLHIIAKDESNYKYIERALAITALYYLDGENYGEQYGRKYIVDEKMKNAREVIVKSKGNCRRPEEMYVLDQTYRTRS